MIRVIHYQRRRRMNANYSLEAIFDDLRQRLSGVIVAQKRIAPVESDNLLPRLRIVWDVATLRKQHIHVTGDINFAILGTKPQTAILTMLDCGFVYRSHGWRRWLLTTLWLRWPVRWARVVTTISETVKQEIVSLTGCRPEKIVVIPVSIADRFQPHPKPFECDAPRILHVGTAPNKNLHRHIEAISGLSCTLVIIGQIDNTTRQMLEAHSVRFENLVDQTPDEVYKQYCLADMLCFASTYEGFGMPILEAQAVGRAVITSSTSSMPEVAGDGALLVDPHSTEQIRQAIMQVIRDPKLRDDLIQRGLRNVRRFGSDDIARQYLQLYQDTWENPRKA